MNEWTNERTRESHWIDDDAVLRHIHSRLGLPSYIVQLKPQDDDDIRQEERRRRRRIPRSGLWFNSQVCSNYDQWLLLSSLLCTTIIIVVRDRTTCWSFCPANGISIDSEQSSSSSSWTSSSSSASCGQLSRLLLLDRSISRTDHKKMINSSTRKKSPSNV